MLREAYLVSGPGRDQPEPMVRADGHYAVVPIVAGGHHHGRIVAFSQAGTLRESDIRILERAATVAALVITKQEAVNAVESKYRADFLRDVLTGRGGGRIAERAKAFGWDLERPVSVMVAELDPESDERTAQDRLLGVWQAAVRRHDPRGAVAGFSHEVVVIVGAGVDTARLAAAAQSSFAECTFSTGMSRIASGAEGLADAYGQALKAARVGRQLHGNGAVAHFDQLGVYRLLSLVNDTAELHAFVRETLGALASDDDAENADLRRTLHVLLETNLNVAETARAPAFPLQHPALPHRQARTPARQLHRGRPPAPQPDTLALPVLNMRGIQRPFTGAKLERLLGNFTEDAHLRLNLTLALHVLNMRGI